MMDVHPIKTCDDNEQALLRIDALMNAEPGTEDDVELYVLVTLVEAFENENFLIESPNF
jgi:HTH-type transcriptional regulator/antitoxin HigA